MNITMTDEEINNTALGIFVDRCKITFDRRTNCDLMEAVYEQAKEFARDLYYDEKIAASLDAPYKHIIYSVLAWVAGKEKIQIEWLLYWCNRWIREYEDKISEMTKLDSIALQPIASEARRFLEELRASEKAVFVEARFLCMRMPCELDEFLNAYMMMITRRHDTIWTYDVELLLAYGYARGVHAERRRRAGKR